MLPSLPRAILLHHAALPAGADGSGAARALLARAAARAGLPPPPQPLPKTTAGQPQWPGIAAVSLAHAEGRVACALGPPGLALGVDLEREGAARASSLRLVTSASERAALASGRLDAVALWILKEAVLKAAGAGVAAVAAVEIGEGVGHHAGRRYRLDLRSAGRGWRLALAWDAAAGDLAVHETGE